MIPRDPTPAELDGRGEPPAGYVWRVMPADDDWRMGGLGRQCRRVGGGGGRAGGSRERCPKAAVAHLMRQHGRRPGRRVPWAYCEDHLYGRWIEDGQIVEVRCVEVALMPERQTPELIEPEGVHPLSAEERQRWIDTAVQILSISKERPGSNYFESTVERALLDYEATVRQAEGERDGLLVLLRRIHDTDALDHARANVLRKYDDMTDVGPDAEELLVLLLALRALFDDDESTGGDDA